MVLVDTSAWVEFFRRDGDPAIKLGVRGLLETYQARLCGPVEMEFLGGAQKQQREKLYRWFAVVPYLRNDQKIWRKAARNYSLLRDNGLTAPWNDVLIATISLEADCRIYSKDKHFRLISSLLKLKLYKPGYNGMYDPDSLDTDL